MGTGTKLDTTLKTFIARHHLFFVATADQTGRVNMSPKGMDSLRILGDTHVCWLNLSGSGNETAADVLRVRRGRDEPAALATPTGIFGDARSPNGMGRKVAPAPLA